MSQDWLPNEERLTIRCPYCGQFSFKKRERNLSDKLDFFDYYLNASRTCGFCNKTVYRSTRWWIITLILAALSGPVLAIGFLYQKMFWFGIIGFVVMIAATVTANMLTPFEIASYDKKNYNNIVIGVQKSKEYLWPRYRSGEIYLITPNKHSYKKQIIAQLEKNYSNKMTFRVIKNVDLDLQNGQILYILTEDNHSIEGIFEKEIPAINTMI